MITHYTLLSHLTEIRPDNGGYVEHYSHAIMRGLKLTKKKAAALAKHWNTENERNRDATRYTVLPATDYCA